MLKSDLIICGSNFIFSHIYENYKNYIHNKKLLVIFRGINLEYFNKRNVDQEIEKKLVLEHKLDKSKKLILLPGRLTTWKGQEMFIEAINNLKIRRPDILFTAIILGNDQGRKIYKKKLQRLVEQYRLINDILFIEHIKNMPAIYNLSDIVVSSSIEPEAFGRVAVEGQAMEKIVLASNIGGSNETIVNKKSGFLFEAGNSEDLLQKLIFPRSKEVLLKSLENIKSLEDMEYLIPAHLTAPIKFTIEDCQKLINEINSQKWDKLPEDNKFLMGLYKKLFELGIIPEEVNL